jgi:hypothetical protein
MQRYLASRRAWLRPETKLDPIVFDEYVGQFELYPDNIITISNEGGEAYDAENWRGESRAIS